MDTLDKSIHVSTSNLIQRHQPVCVSTIHLSLFSGENIEVSVRSLIGYRDDTSASQIEIPTVERPRVISSGWYLHKQVSLVLYSAKLQLEDAALRA
jgi:hypothetical protein